MAKKSNHVVYEYPQRKNGGWGVPYALKNGSITVEPGMVQDIMNGRIDMIAGSLFMLEERLVAMDFLVDTEIDEFGAIGIRKDDFFVAFDYEVFHRPFQWKTWLLLLTVIITSSGFFWAFEKKYSALEFLGMIFF